MHYKEGNLGLTDEASMKGDVKNKRLHSRFGLFLGGRVRPAMRSCPVLCPVFPFTAMPVLILRSGCSVSSLVG